MANSVGLAVADMIVDPLRHRISYLSVSMIFRGQAPIFILYQLAIAMKQTVHLSLLPGTPQRQGLPIISTGLS